MDRPYLVSLIGLKVNQFVGCRVGIESMASDLGNGG
jgi:hypothetical protein